MDEDTKSNETETPQGEVTEQVNEAQPKTKSDAGEAPKVMPIISIGVVEGTNELAVSGQIHNKRICLNALADAIKIITNIQGQEAPGVIVPKSKEEPKIVLPGQ